MQSTKNGLAEKGSRPRERALGVIGPDAAPAVPALMRSLMQPEPLAPPADLRPIPQN
jgi:hypothetical protein